MTPLASLMGRNRPNPQPANELNPLRSSHHQVGNASSPGEFQGSDRSSVQSQVSSPHAGSLRYGISLAWISARPSWSRSWG